jgi:hypothetical protein
MGIEVSAGGNKSDRPTEKIGVANVRVWATARMEIRFAERRGVGERYYELNVKPSDFEELAKAMMYANSEQAIKAFGAALELGLIPRPSVDHTNAHIIVFPPDEPDASAAA